MEAIDRRTDQQWQYDEWRRSRTFKLDREHLARSDEGLTWRDVAKAARVSLATVLRRVRVAETVNLLVLFVAAVVPAQAQQKLSAVHDLRVVAADRGEATGLARVELQWQHSGVPLAAYRTAGGFTITGTTPRERVAVLRDCVDPLDPHLWVFADMPPYSDFTITEVSTGNVRTYHSGPSGNYVRDYKAFKSCGQSARGGESWSAQIERAVEYHVDFSPQLRQVFPGAFYGAQLKAARVSFDNSYWNEVQAGAFSVVAWAASPGAFSPSDPVTVRLDRGNDPEPDPEPGSCPSDALCFHDGAFEVRVSWTVGDTDGVGQPFPLTDADGGLFTFFDPRNPEMLVKVLDGCSFNGHYWFYLAAATDIQYTLTVRRVPGGAERHYVSDGGLRPGVADTAAFACR